VTRAEPFLKMGRGSAWAHADHYPLRAQGWAIQRGVKRAAITYGAFVLNAYTKPIVNVF
jgi:hypothetical protein